MPSEGARMPHWRRMTWALVLWLALGVAGFAYVVSVVGCEGLTGRALTDCQVGNSVLAMTGLYWIIGALILAAFWAATRPKSGARGPVDSVCSRCEKPLSPSWRDRCHHC